jgi:transmembrane sensor
MNTDINYDILFWKFFNNEADASEKQALLNWVKLSDENKKAFADARSIYLQSKHSLSNDTFNFEDAYSNFVHKTRRRKISIWKVTSIAAGFLILIGLGSMYFNNTSNIEEVKAETIFYASEVSETKTILLPDSSTVTLHREALLSYSYDENNQRKATLNGEAFFDITHNPNSPFVLCINEITITVLGTSFIVNASTLSSNITVNVLSGKVSVASNTDTIIIEKDETAIFEKENKKLSISNNFDINNIAWKTNELYFESTLLYDVADKLSKYFDKRFVITDSVIGNLPLTVNFTNPELYSTMRLLELAFNISVHETDTAIVMEKKRK